MTDREKLIELIISSGQVYGFVGALADHLIINGVTMCEREMLHQTYEQGKYEGALEGQKWIPVTERLPEDDDVFLCWSKEIADMMFCYTSDFKQMEVTHWMPLPEPPKEG